LKRFPVGEGIKIYGNGRGGAKKKLSHLSLWESWESMDKKKAGL
jgi:hypothetical protein